MDLLILKPIIFLATQRPIEIIQPCNPSPCGRNAECKERGQTAASCTFVFVFVYIY